MRLFEKYRPASLDDVVGQDKAVTTPRRVLKDGAGVRLVNKHKGNFRAVLNDLESGCMIGGGA